ncbi:DUF494 family protein [bacterium]|nr:DUF494 family protein [bacterium]
MKKNIKKLLKDFMEEETKGVNEEDPIVKLEKMGFSGQEIDEVIESFSKRARAFVATRRFNRVLSESEKLNLSTAAQGYLIKLIDNGLISEYELGILLETISIERDYPASLKDVKLVIERFIADLHNDLINANSKTDIRIN